MRDPLSATDTRRPDTIRARNQPPRHAPRRAHKATKHGPARPTPAAPQHAHGTAACAYVRQPRRYPVAHQAPKDKRAAGRERPNQRTQNGAQKEDPEYTQRRPPERPTSTMMMILHAQVWSWDALAMSARSGVPFWHPHPWVSRRVPSSMRARQRSHENAPAIATVATNPAHHRAHCDERVPSVPDLTLSRLLDRERALPQGRLRRRNLAALQWHGSASASER